MSKPELARMWFVFTAILVSGCQTLDDSPAVNTWNWTPLATASAQGKSTVSRPRGAALEIPGSHIPSEQHAFLYEGSGELVGDSPRSRLSIPPGDDGVTLNLINTPIPQAAKTILGDILHLNYSVNARLDGKITIQTSTAVSRAGLIDLFQNALRSSGVVIIKNGSLYQIEPVDQAAKIAPEVSVGTNIKLDDVGAGARVIQLKYITASEMRRILEPMAAKSAILRADDARNTLILAGTNSDISAILDTISIFDIDVMKGMSIAVVPVHTTQPDVIVDELYKVFGGGKEGLANAAIRFVPNQRLKSILVISPHRSSLTEVQAWIRRLDAKTEGADKQVFTYRVRNRPATELIAIIESAFSSSQRNAASASRNVAPRYQQANVQSGQNAAGASSLPGIGAQGSTNSPGVGFNGGVNALGSNGGTSPTSANLDSQSSDTSIGIGPSGEEERVHVAVDQANNALIIIASRQDYQRVLKIAEHLDIIPNQVMIEATIAEVSLTDDLSFGVRWFFQGKKASYSLTDAASAAFGSSFPGFSYALAFANIQATLNALNSITKVNIISSPSLTVLDHRTAVLQIGDQVPIVTQSAVGVITTGAPIVNSVNYRDTGIILSITPSIAESGHVLLNIEQEVSSVASTTTSNIDSPTIKQRRVKTTVLVKNGDALVLGGLIQDQVTDTRSQIPVLGDIPLLGNATGQKQHSIGKTELIILISPHVIHNSDEAREISDEYRRRFDIRTPQTRTGSPTRTLQRIIN